MNSINIFNVTLGWLKWGEQKSNTETYSTTTNNRQKEKENHNEHETSFYTLTCTNYCSILCCLSFVHFAHSKTAFLSVTFSTRFLSDKGNIGIMPVQHFLSGFLLLSFHFPLSIYCCIIICIMWQFVVWIGSSHFLYLVHESDDTDKWTSFRI